MAFGLRFGACRLGGRGVAGHEAQTLVAGVEGVALEDASDAVVGEPDAAPLGACQLGGDARGPEAGLAEGEGHDALPSSGGIGPASQSVRSSSVTRPSPSVVTPYHPHDRPRGREVAELRALGQPLGHRHALAGRGRAHAAAHAAATPATSRCWSPPPGVAREGRRPVWPARAAARHPTEHQGPRRRGRYGDDRIAGCTTRPRRERRRHRGRATVRTPVRSSRARQPSMTSRSASQSSRRATPGTRSAFAVARRVGRWSRSSGAWRSARSAPTRTRPSVYRPRSAGASACDRRAGWCRWTPGARPRGRWIASAPYPQRARRRAAARRDERRQRSVRCGPAGRPARSYRWATPLQSPEGAGGHRAAAGSRRPSASSNAEARRTGCRVPTAICSHSPRGRHDPLAHGGGAGPRLIAAHPRCGPTDCRECATRRRLPARGAPTRLEAWHGPAAAGEVRRIGRTLERDDEVTSRERSFAAIAPAGLGRGADATLGPRAWRAPPLRSARSQAGARG